MDTIPPATFEYESIPGFFIQSDPSTDASTYDFRKHNFGLIDREYATDKPADSSLTQWQRFTNYLSHLNATSPQNVQYKLFYAGRHGQGYHNVAESFYGTQAWDDYWSKLEGNGTVVWADARLTDVGEEQAREAGVFLGEQFAWAGMPVPGEEGWFVSPLVRCLRTAELTWAGLEVFAERPFNPLIMEMLREVMGEHTCDRRSSRSFIHGLYPGWRIEEGFMEEDELWLPDHRETHEEHDVRTRKALDQIFEGSGEGLVVSTTTHSGQIASLLRVVGHREFRLPTGSMIPVLIKATKIK